VVEVSFEQPKPPEPPPPAPTATPTPTPAPTPPVEGLRPPAEITSDKPTQVRPTSENPSAQDRPQSPPQESREKALEQAFEKAMPPLPKPTPAPTPPPKPQQQALAIPPANPNPRPPPPQPPQPQPAPPQIAPSPLSRVPQQERPSAIARGKEAPQSSPFVNPADTYNRARVSDNYLWEVVRKLQGYRYQANVQGVSQSVTVVRVTIARDGRLLDVAIARSSGFPEMDSGVIAGVRAGSPYTPLPADIQGAAPPSPRRWSP
jgi:protein TonB